MMIPQNDAWTEFFAVFERVLNLDHMSIKYFRLAELLRTASLLCIVLL